MNYGLAKHKNMSMVSDLACTESECWAKAANIGVWKWPGPCPNPISNSNTFQMHNTA